MKSPSHTKFGVSALVVTSIFFWVGGAVAGSIYFFGAPPWLGFTLGGALLLMMVAAGLALVHQMRAAVEHPDDAGRMTPTWESPRRGRTTRFTDRHFGRGEPTPAVRRTRREPRPLVRKG